MIACTLLRRLATDMVIVVSSYSSALFSALHQVLVHLTLIRTSFLSLDDGLFGDANEDLTVFFSLRSSFAFKSKPISYATGLVLRSGELEERSSKAAVTD